MTTGGVGARGNTTGTKSRVTSMYIKKRRRITSCVLKELLDYSENQEGEVKAASAAVATDDYTQDESTIFGNTQGLKKVLKYFHE